MRALDRVIEVITLLLIVVVSLWIVVTPVIQFVNTGRSPYMVLCIWYVAEIWYRLFRRE